MALRAAMVMALAAAGSAPAFAASRCNVTVTNADAEGTATNVRAGPSTRSKVLLSLDNEALVELRVVGVQGEWFRIDRIDDVEQGKPVHRGAAWIHRSQAGLSVAGGNHRLYAAPSRKSAALMKLTPDGNLLDLIDCRGDWAKVVVDGKKTGWMARDARCSNPMTTCS